MGYWRSAIPPSCARERLLVASYCGGWRLVHLGLGPKDLLRRHGADDRRYGCTSGSRPNWYCVLWVCDFRPQIPMSLSISGDMCAPFASLSSKSQTTRYFRRFVTLVTFIYYYFIFLYFFCISARPT